MNSTSTILVVEGDPAVRRRTRQVLFEAGFATWSADDLEGARYHLCFSPTLAAVVCDYELPNGTGLDLLAWLQQQNRARLAFVLLSGSGHSEPAAAPLFACECLRTPFLAPQLLAALDRAFQRVRQPFGTSEPAAERAAAPPDSLVQGESSAGWCVPANRGIQSADLTDSESSLTRPRAALPRSGAAGPCSRTGCLPSIPRAAPRPLPAATASWPARETAAANTTDLHPDVAGRPKSLSALVTLIHGNACPHPFPGLET